MSSFDSTPVWSEVKSILNKTTDPALFEYRGKVHTEKEDFDVWDMNSIEIARDYLTKVAETGRVVFRLGLGDYTHRFYPFRTNLEFTLTKVPVGKNVRGETTVIRCKAIFNPANNPQVGGTELTSQSYETLNTVDMVEVYLELMDRSMEPLRIKTTGGAFQNKTAYELIHGLLGGESMKVLVDGKPAIHAIDIVEPDRKEKFKNVIVPHGTKITNFPTYLQEYLGGVYNRGLGTFFQTYKGKKTWFVYPTHDTERFDSKDPKVVFYAVPEEKLPQLDKSYRLEGDLLKVIVTANRRYADSAEIDQLNSGSGFRMPDTNAFLKKPVEIGPNGPLASRARLNTEIINKERDDGLNYAPILKHGAASNPYAMRSAVLARTLAQVDIVWENANPDLIYPGMPCKYVFMSQGRVVSLKGTVLFVHAFSARVEKYNASAFRTTTRISIACEPQDKTTTLPSKGTAREY